MQTWLHWRRQDALLVQKHFVALFHPKPNECLRFDLESCNLMCTYTVVTHPCDIPPLAQARPMMLYIYTSNNINLHRVTCTRVELDFPSGEGLKYSSNLIGSWATPNCACVFYVRAL